MMNEQQLKLRMEALSQDALAVLGCYFGMGGMQTELTFHMVQSRPTARLQKALAECVGAGVLNSKPFNKLGGVTYTLAAPITDYRRKVHKAAQSVKDFTLTEPING